MINTTTRANIVMVTGTNNIIINLYVHVLRFWLVTETSAGGI